MSSRLAAAAAVVVVVRQLIWMSTISSDGISRFWLFGITAVQNMLIRIQMIVSLDHHHHRARIYFEGAKQWAHPPKRIYSPWRLVGQWPESVCRWTLSFANNNGALDIGPALLFYCYWNDQSDRQTLSRASRPTIHLLDFGPCLLWALPNEYIE